MTLALGVDFGTSGVRAIALDRFANIRALSKTDYDINSTQSWAEALWTVLGSLDQALRQNIRAIAINGTSGTVLTCDQQGRPYSAPLLYNFSAGAVIQEQLSGFVPPHSPARPATSSLAKLLWLMGNLSMTEPLYFLHQADWLSFLLHGKLGISDYHNALKLGYDVVALAYPPWFPDTPFLLPKVLPPSQPIGQVVPAIAQKFALSPDCLVYTGTTDSTAACLSSMAGQKLELQLGMTALGSTLVVKVISPTPLFQGDYGIYSHRLEWQGRTYFLVGGASNTGGAVLRHFFTDRELVALSQQIDPSQPSPYAYYPLLQQGERFPINNPSLLPRLDPRPPLSTQFLHGLLESIARIEQQGYALLHRLGCPLPKQIITTGSGAHNPTWQAIRQRVLGIPVSRAQHTEAAYGTALMIREALG